MHEQQHSTVQPRSLAPTPAPAASPQQAMDGALAGLDRLADLPLTEHVERFESAHAALVAALSAIDRD